MFTTSDGQVHDRSWYLNVYLHSEHWDIIRGAQLRNFPYCENCKTTDNLRVHHVNYRQIYDVKLDDLKTLCEDCHNEEHKRLSRIGKPERKAKKQALRLERRKLKRDHTNRIPDDPNVRYQYVHNGHHLWNPNRTLRIYCFYTGDMLGTMLRKEAIKKYSDNPNGWFGTYEKHGKTVVSLFGSDSIPGFKQTILVHKAHKLLQEKGISS